MFTAGEDVEGREAEGEAGGSGRRGNGRGMGPAPWLEEDVLEDVFNLSQHFGYSKYSGMYG